jgi:hypothetical protein
LADETKHPTSKVWYSGRGGLLVEPNLPLFLTKEFIDQSLGFPVHSIVKLSLTEPSVTHNMNASEPTCLVSQSRKFKARFTLFR